MVVDIVPTLYDGDSVIIVCIFEIFTSMQDNKANVWHDVLRFYACLFNLAPLQI